MYISSGSDAVTNSCSQSRVLNLKKQTNKQTNKQAKKKLIRVGSNITNLSNIIKI